MSRDGVSAARRLRPGEEWMRDDCMCLPDCDCPLSKEWTDGLCDTCHGHKVHEADAREQGALAVARAFDEDAFLCDFGGRRSVNLPNLERVVDLGEAPR